MIKNFFIYSTYWLLGGIAFTIMLVIYSLTCLWDVLVDVVFNLIEKK